MKLIEQSAEICKTHGYTLQDIYKDIERAARVSYKSEDKITEDSAEKMVKRLINMKHYSPLEFGTVYLEIDDIDKVQKYINNPYSRVSGDCYVTTNYRVIIENHWQQDLKYLVEPTRFHMRRITAHFITNRAVSHELVRHRSMSFMQESQRYCNYSKGKFNNELTFIYSVSMYSETTSLHSENSYVDFLTAAENKYMDLIDKGWKPQQARIVLPNATKTELYMCGFEDDWDHFFELRDKDTVDPQTHGLVIQLHLQYNVLISETEGRLRKSETVKKLESIYP